MLTKIRKSAQSTLEYALLIGIVAGGLLYMQNYVKRGVQGKVQAAVDDLGDQYSPGLTYRHSFMEATLGNEPTVETTRGGVFAGWGADGIGDEPAGTTTVRTGKITQEQRSVRRLEALDKENWTATGGAASGQ